MMYRACALPCALLVIGLCLPTRDAAGQNSPPLLPNDYYGSSPDDATLNGLLERLRRSEERIRQLEQGHPYPSNDGSAYVNAYAPTDEDLAGRVQGLEQEIAKQKEAAAKAKADAASKPSQKWSGRIHADYWAFPDSGDAPNFWENGDPTEAVEDRVLFRRVRFGPAGEMFDTMLYKIEMEFASPNRLAFKDVYIGWKELPVARTVLLGNQKRPYGLDHLNSSRYNVYMERPFIVEAINPDARRFGACSYGISENERWNWRLGAFLPVDMQSTGIYETAEDNLAHTYQAEVAGRLANTVWYDENSGGRGYAHWAVSGSYIRPDVSAGAANVARFQTRPEARTSTRWLDTGVLDAEHYVIGGLEGLVNLGPLSVCGEYMVADVNRNGAASSVTFPGYYVYVAYFLTGEHTPWELESGTLGRTRPFENFFLVRTCDGERAAGWGAWQVSARYSHADFNDADIQGGIGDSFTFALNWWWTPYSRVQFNYIYGSIDGRYPQNISSTTGLPAGAAGPNVGDYDVWALRWMVDF